MRILHVTAGIGRSNGVMSVILNYARHMPEDITFDVMYFIQTDDDRTSEIEALGGRATKITPPGLHSFRKDDVDAYLRDHRGEYAAIHLHLPYLASAFAPKAHRAGIKRVIVHCHSSRFSLKGNGWRNRILNIPTKCLATDLLACGRDAGRVWYGRSAMQHNKMWVLPNAIECERFAYNAFVRTEVRRALGLDEQLVIGHVGTLTTPKNHKFLLPVFAAICRQQPNAVLLLIGDGSLRKQIQAQAVELGIQNQVIMLVDRNDVPGLLQAMDIFIFPSLHEGLPVSVVEAQAAGLPVLMSDTITDEVCVTDRILQLQLSAPPSVWAEKALDLTKRRKRQDCTEQVIAAGFDLEKNAEKLAEFYRR